CPRQRHRRRDPAPRPWVGVDPAALLAKRSLVATQPGRRPPAYGGAPWGKILDGLTWVRLTFVDVFGAAHSFQVPSRLFLESVERGVPFDGSALEGRSRLAEKDMRLKADPFTLRRIDDHVGRAICNVTTADGQPWLGDPRTAL